jgi:hypothetical protein
VRLRQALTSALGHYPSPSELQSWGNALMNGGSLPSAKVSTPTTSAAINTTYSMLKVYNPSCDASTPISASCNNAINRFCGERGYGAGGFGPVEHAGDVAIVTCVPTAGQASQISTSFTDLKSFQPACNSADSINVACGSAINRFCASQGYGSGGFGPLEYSGDAAVVSCAMSPRADLVTDTFTNLSTYQSGCNGATASTDFCKAAIHRRCKAAGYVSGFGVLEYNGDTVVFSCVR